MKNNSRLTRAVHKKPQPRQGKPAVPSSGGRTSKAPAWRWPAIVLLVLLTAGGTWAAFEFFVLARIPPELVGKWVVDGGPQDGSTFDFSRNGTVEAHFNIKGMDHLLQGKVAVEDKKLLITTQNPNTKQDETRSCLIRELTQTSFIVEFEKGEVFKMKRAE